MASQAMWEQETGYKRNAHRDTEAERRPVKPQHAPQKRSEHSTGFASQAADLLTEDVMQRALNDRMAEVQADCAEEPYAKDTQGEEGEAPYAKDDDDDLEALRARRRQQMKEKIEKDKEYSALGHGEYDEITEEEFLKTVTSSKRCVVHFYHKNFERCKIMDMHLLRCARRFYGTRFVKLDSEKAPFFVQKLQVKTLPCAIVFVDGVAKGRQMGFHGLEGGDSFRTAHLAWQFKGAGGIEEDFGEEDDIE